MDPRVTARWLSALIGRRLSDRGAAMVEYVLLVALIAVVVLLAVKFFGDETSTKYSTTTSELFES